MTPEEKSAIERDILRLIEYDFRKDFLDLFGLAVQFVGEPLFQASDEVRNFLDHASLALIAKDVADAQLNLGRGKKHLYYGKYLCLLVPCYTKLAHATDGLRIREERRGRPIPQLRAKLEDIRREYKAIKTIKVTLSKTMDEVNGAIEELNSVNRQLEEVLVKLNGYENQVKSYYWAPGINQLTVWPTLWRITRWLYNHWLGVALFAVIMNLIAAIIYAFFFDRPIQGYLRDRPTVFWRPSNQLPASGPSNAPAGKLPSLGATPNLGAPSQKPSVSGPTPGNADMKPGAATPPPTKP